MCTRHGELVERVSHESIKSVLAKYSAISGLTAITHNRYGMSKLCLEIELRQDIPSLLTM